MTRVFHLAWHDFRSQRLPLALFLAVLAAEVVTIWVVPDPGRRLTVVPVMPVIRLILTSLLTALIVHRDPLVGTTAFWQTRPIAGPLLMAGKATSVGIGLIVVPSLVMGAAWWNTGLWFSDAVELAGVTAIEHAVVVVLSAMAAVVTPTLTHLVVAGVAGTTLVTVINGIVLPAIVNTWPFVGQGAGATRPGVYLGILLPLGAVAVVHQYLTRREWRTAALVGVALLAASGGARMWPRSESVVPETPVNRAAIDPSAVVIRTLPDTVTRTEQSRRAKGAVVPYARYAAVLTASGNPAAVFLELNRIESRLILGNRTVVSEQGRWGVLADASRDQALRTSLQEALRPAVLPAPSPIPWRAQATPAQLVEMTVADESRHLGERGILTMKAGLDARRFVIASSIQVRPGAVLRGPGLSLEVTRVAPGTSDLVTARLSRLQGFDSWLFLARTYFVLRNVKRREAFVLNTGGTWGGLTGTAGILRLAAYRTTGTLNPWSTGNRVHGAVSPPDAAWLADAELLLVTAESVGTFTREFQTEIVVGK